MSTEMPKYDAHAPESLGMALAAAVGVGVLGVIGWVAIADAFQARTALVAFGVALGTAAAFRRFAPSNPLGPPAVVVLTIASALVGLLASQYALLAHDAHLGFFTVVNRLPASKIPTLMTTGTGAFTWVIIALSGLSGYRASMRLRMHQQRSGYRPTGYVPNNATPPSWQPPTQPARSIAPAAYVPPTDPTGVVPPPAK
jgi:hypothetical protein